MLNDYVTKFLYLKTFKTINLTKMLALHSSLYQVTNSFTGNCWKMTGILDIMQEAAEGNSLSVH
jgi:hypothetical protein